MTGTVLHSGLLFVISFSAAFFGKLGEHPFLLMLSPFELPLDVFPHIAPFTLLMGGIGLLQFGALIPVGYKLIKRGDALLSQLRIVRSHCLNRIVILLQAALSFQLNLFI